MRWLLPLAAAAWLTGVTEGQVNMRCGEGANAHEIHSDDGDLMQRVEPCL